VDLAPDFERIISLCEELEEATPLPKRLKRRIANAYSMAVGKAAVLGWYAKEDPDLLEDNVRFKRTLMRHAERGAREYIA